MVISWSWTHLVHATGVVRPETRTAGNDMRDAESLKNGYWLRGVAPAAGM